MENKQNALEKTPQDEEKEDGRKKTRNDLSRLDARSGYVKDDVNWLHVSKFYKNNEINLKDHIGIFGKFSNMIQS